MATTKPSNVAHFTAAFSDPHDLLHAVQDLRAQGVPVLDTYSPFPVHGMDDALGLGPSKITYFCAAFAALGLASAAALQYWTSVIDYPLNIGGKPLNSIPAFIPVAFELTVLFAGLGTVGTLLVLNKLRPRFKVPKLFPRVNDDRFVLLAQVPAGASLARLEAGLARRHPLAIERYFEPEAQSNPFWNREVSVPAMVAGVLLPSLAVLGLGGLFNRDFTRRVLAFDAGMTTHASAQAFDSSGVLPRGQVLQHPPEGTMARGQHLPLAFAAGKEEAERAGRELKAPLQPTPKDLARGAVVWNRTCAACHGEGAKGDGPVIPRFPNPPNLLIPKYLDYPEGRLFHVATFGGPEKIMKGFADQIPEDDRWRAVLHLRSLQLEAAKAREAQAAKIRSVSAIAAGDSEKSPSAIVPVPGAPAGAPLPGGQK